MSKSMQNCALILIDVQKGFLDTNYWGQSHNHNILNNLEILISKCRELKLPIIHIQHLSNEDNSPLRPGQDGVEFIDSCAPRRGEHIFQKCVNSAFIGTNLESYLRSKNIYKLILSGFTTDHCVSTTARMSSNLGFNTVVLADCTTTFARKGLRDSFYPAEVVHNVNLASLSQEFAIIINSLEELKLE